MRTEWCLYFLRAPATTAVVSLARFGRCLCLCCSEELLLRNICFAYYYPPNLFGRWCNPIEQVASLAMTFQNTGYYLHYCTDSTSNTALYLLASCSVVQSDWTSCVTLRTNDSTPDTPDITLTALENLFLQRPTKTVVKSAQILASLHGVRIWAQSCVRGTPFFLQRSSLLSTWHWHTGNQHSLSETRVCMYLMVNQTLGL